jgi:hypothetical protein
MNFGKNLEQKIGKFFENNPDAAPALAVLSQGSNQEEAVLSSSAESANIPANNAAQNVAKSVKSETPKMTEMERIEAEWKAVEEAGSRVIAQAKVQNPETKDFVEVVPVPATLSDAAKQSFADFVKVTKSGRLGK